MPNQPTRTAARSAGALALAACGLFAAGAASAKDPDLLRMRSLAATCAHCHGTDGRAVAGEAMVPLAGVPQQHLFQQLMAFRDGSRPATVMHQIAKGYSPEQLKTLAQYFASRK